MNHLKIRGAVVQSGSVKKFSPGAIQLYRATLNYALERVAESYYTPDDAEYEVAAEALAIPKSPLHIIINFTPYRRIGKIAKHRGPNLTMVLDYDNDVELTERLYDDIMLILSHFGLSGLYNNTGNQITVNINPTSKRI